MVIGISGGGVTGWDVDGDTSVSLVVSVFSDVVSGLVSLVVVVGTAVDTVTVVRVGTGTAAVMVVGRGTAAGVSPCLVVLAVVTDPADVAMVVDGTPGMVVVPGLGGTVGGPIVVDLVVSAGGLGAMVTLAVTGRTVDLGVDVILGVTLVVTGTLGVVLKVVVLVMVVVVVAGVALSVDTSRVVTLSRTVVGLGGAVEVVVCS